MCREVTETVTKSSSVVKSVDRVGVLFLDGNLSRIHRSIVTEPTACVLHRPKMITRVSAVCSAQRRNIGTVRAPLVIYTAYGRWMGIRTNRPLRIRDVLHLRCRVRVRVTVPFPVRLKIVGVRPRCTLNFFESTDATQEQAV